MALTLILFFLFSLTCEVLGTVGGFGSSLFFMPLSRFFLPAQPGLALTGILHVFSNSFKLWMFRKGIHLKLLLQFGIPGLVFTMLGAWAQPLISPVWATWVLGGFLILFSITLLVLPRLELPASPFSAILTGSIAGAAAGMLGTGGAVRGLGLTAYGLDKEAFVATSAAIDWAVDFSRTLIYLYMGFMQPQYWAWVPLLAAASWLGTWIGKRLLKYIPEERFRSIVLVLILATGIVVLAGLEA